MNGNPIIERAYQLINTPLNPNLTTPLELVDIVAYKTAEAGEDVEYFASPSQDRGVDGIYSIDANGSLTYHKIELKSTTPISFSGIQTKLSTVLLDELMNGKDNEALASVKSNIILQMDNHESRLAMDLILGAESQRLYRETGEDLLDVLIRLKQKVSNYSSDYVLIVSTDVMDAIERYDKENVDSFLYKMSIHDEIAKLGIKKIVKVVGDDVIDDETIPILKDGVAIIVGRNSKLLQPRPLVMVRRKFSGNVARNSGAEEGAVRLVQIVPTPYVVNAEGKQTLGYGVFGYSSLAMVLINYRAVASCDDILG